MTDRLSSGSDRLDGTLGGGLMANAINFLLGPPGSGKTILAQQLCFHNASREQPVLYFNTLSEPSAKTLQFIGEKTFDPSTGKLNGESTIVQRAFVAQAGQLP